MRKEFDAFQRLQPQTERETTNKRTSGIKTTNTDTRGAPQSRKAPYGEGRLLRMLLRLLEIAPIDGARWREKLELTVATNRRALGAYGQDQRRTKPTVFNAAAGAAAIIVLLISVITFLSHIQN